MKHKSKLLTLAIIALIAIILILIFYNQNQTSDYGLKEITYKEILTKQENKENFILIVSRSNCSHCATYKPKVEQIAIDYDITVYYINIDKLSEANETKFLEDNNLSGATPMTLFFVNGKETTILNRIEGDLSIKTVKEQFKKMGFID